MNSVWVLVQFFTMVFFFLLGALAVSRVIYFFVG